MRHAGMPPSTVAAALHEREEELDLEPSHGSLLDAVDRLIDKGTVLQGDLLISIADVDLVRVNLDLLLAAVETLEQSQKRRDARLNVGPESNAVPVPVPVPGSRPVPASDPGAHSSRLPVPCSLFPVSAEPAPAPVAPDPKRLALDPRSAEKGVARLVLTLVEFIRRLLERQAIRRMEGGLLKENSVERMGEALARLESVLEDMKTAFGLEGETLDLDLGPLGRLNGPER